MKENYIHTGDSEENNLPNSLRSNPFVVPFDFFEKQAEEIQNQIKLEQALSSNLMNENAVPQNYFNELENNIFARISEINLKEQAESDGFDLPPNYFENLNTNIQGRIFEEKLKTITSESDFEVPSEYFNKLENSIATKIAEANLRELILSDGFSTPTGYFDNLEECITNHITLEKLEINQSEETFNVPSGYFESLENKIKNKIESTNEEHSTPIISLSKRKTNWSRYSAAAAVLIVGIGTYFTFDTSKLFDSKSTETTTANVNLQSVSDEELVNYLAQVSEDQDLLHLSGIVQNKTGEPLHIESEMKDADIEEYLNYML